MTKGICNEVMLKSGEGEKYGNVREKRMKKKHALK